MSCAEFESLLLEYVELTNDTRACVDAHLTLCSGCREFLHALRTVDSQLSAEFSAVQCSPSFAPAVRRRVQAASPLARPSPVPEFLDFVGWGAIASLVGLLTWWLMPVSLVSLDQLLLPLNISLAAGVAFALAALLVGIRSLVDLKY
jgi:predicted anti-sigma-YlaC factor YlaD